MALANIHRPGAMTPSVVLSLGLGLAVLVTLTLIDSNLRGQLRQNLPGETPSFYFLDVRSAEIDGFRQFLAAKAPDAKIVEAPMMRGRFVKIGTDARRRCQGKGECRLGAGRRSRRHLCGDAARRVRHHGGPMVAAETIPDRRSSRWRRKSPTGSD